MFLYPETLQQRVSFLLHATGLGGRLFVVITKQMQNAVNQQFDEALFKGDAGGLGFALAGFDGYDHISQQMGAHFAKFACLHGKGNHIGRPLAPQVLMVQRGDAVVVDDQQGKLGLRRCQGV